MIRFEASGRNLAGGVTFGNLEFFGDLDATGGKKRYSAGFGWRF